GASAVWITPPSRDVAHVRLFLHDRPYASILVALYARDQPPSRELVRETYQAVLERDELAPCLSGALSLSPVQTIGFLRSKIAMLDARPQVAVEGIHQIGDALMAINPLTSKGAGLGLIQAEMLAGAIASDVADYDAQRDAMLHTYREWILPHWADGVLRGSHLAR